ncbi:hypothetical protein PF010_g3388 [Phytophthora fragariae]|uniref:Uncharacterized protein n=1 Tax=Phytophthora fragariae TaxID=53985 RepID=A0A6G0PMI3_9STRA|nr:hypothetical protein PF010_g3388 [Phytophthora fragariae]KAE9249827.1 hypothetical protein PF004_g3213 [Phytophthora fragariae]
MRIAAVLAVAAAYGVLVDALTQEDPGHPMLRELSGNENQSKMLPAISLLADATVAKGGSCWTEKKSCTLNTLLGDTCALPIPIPTDNYVADKRINKFDVGAAASEAPFIEISATGAGLSPTTGKTSWLQYANNAKAVQGAIEFTLPGVYDVKIAAWDYNDDTWCTGCVAINDDVRPSFAAGNCPVQPSTAAHSLSAYSDLQAYEQSYDTGIAAEQVNNPGSGEPCNQLTVETKSLFASTLTNTDGSPAASAAMCFGASALQANIASLKGGNLGGLLTTFLQYEQETLETYIAEEDVCTWSCSKSYVLKEMLGAYECPGTTSVTPVCTGTATCPMEASIKVTPADIASADVTVLSGAKEISGRRAVHFVYGTRRVYGQAVTTVKIEAWTACGLVEAFTFDVNVYLHSELSCTNFKGLWSGLLKESEPDTFCSAPGSDFAALHMSYAVGDLIPPVNGQVTGSFGGITCEIMVKEEAVSPVPDNAYATLFTRSPTSPAIDEDFAVEMVHDPNTARKTAFKVKCTVTRTPGGNTMLADVDTEPPQEEFVGPHSVICSHTFYVMDCDGPKLDSDTAVCENECAGNAGPGMGEACGGRIVTSNALATAVTVYAEGQEQTCCTECSLQCNTVGSSTVKHCEVASSVGRFYFGSYTELIWSMIGLLSRR